MGMKSRAVPPRLARRDRRAAASDVARADASLFEPLTEGERADALRLVTESPKLAAMAKVGRYRVVAVEPLVFKPPEPRAGSRLAHVVIYDYSADKRVDACADLDAGEVFHVSVTASQPMLSDDEEADAIAIAVADEKVSSQLALGEEPVAALQYWSRHEPDLAFRRRSAAVLFGQPGATPSLVAVVDLVDRAVTDVVPAHLW